VHTALLPDWLNDLSDQVGALLNSTLDVLVYSGDKDFICNWRGGEKWTHEVEWSGKQDFQNATYHGWGLNPAKPEGQLKLYENLKFLRVFDAGHMVPMNQPDAALQMLNSFIGQGPLFSSFKTPTEVSPVPNSET